MPEAATKTHSEHLDQLSAALDTGTLAPVRRMLNALQPGEIAHLLESLPPRERELVWNLVDPSIEGEVLVELADEVRSGLVRNMDTAELVAATEGMEADDMADLIQNLPDRITQQILELMDYRDRQRLEAVLQYDEDTAGGLMNTDTVTVRADVPVDVVLRYLRLRGELPEHTDSLIVVNREEKYLGMLPLDKLVTSNPDRTVAEIVDTSVPAIPVDMPATEVAQLFENRDLISAPVVDENQILLGRITIDDVVDVIRDEADKNILGHAGLDEDDDIFAPVLPSTQRRAVWLGINLLTAFLASWVIGQFQGTLQKVIALAVLMPIVASMGGIAGTQTMTLVIRGMALGQIGKSNTRWIFFKEVAVGFLNGVIWALVVAAITVVWFKDLQLGGIIAVAMIANLLIAALSGVILPITMRKMGIDPALAGGVVLTTITDVMGFMVFLGLATLFLL